MPWKDRTVLDNRVEFVTVARSSMLSVSELCRRFGISRKTGYKWLSRAAAEPPEAGPAPPLAARLVDRSRRPECSPQRTAGALQDAVLAVRHAHPAWGGRKIARVLERDRQMHIAPSTVTHVLHRHGCISQAASAAATPWRRFVHDAPNRMWQMDFKGHFALDEGRCHPLTMLDDHSRFNLALAACPNERRSGVQTRLQETFTRYGLPERINADNGSPWGSAGQQPALTGLAVWLMRLGIRLSHSAPAHPQTNGKQERFHRTLKAEVLQQRYRDLHAVQRRFDDWRHDYNWLRPHESLAQDTPGQHYRPSPRAWPGALPPIEYGPGDLVRAVGQGGWISFKGRQVRLSKGLIGEPVALRASADQDGVYAIYFCHHYIDTIDLRQPVEG